MINSKGNKNKNFKGQWDNEYVHAFCRKHWIVIIKDILGFIIFTTVLFILVINYKSLVGFFKADSLLFIYAEIIIVIVGSIYLHLFFLRMINYFLSVLILTNQRIVELDKSLYLRDSKDAIDLSKIQDINKKQHGILQNFLRYGDLSITLSGTSMTRTITLVPNPDYHFRKINNIKAALLNSRVKPNENNENKDNFSL